VLGLTSPDPVLSVAGSIGLAASRGTALIIDLADPRTDGDRRTLRDIVSDGPSLHEMSPGRQGVAMIRGGGIDHSAAVAIIEELAARWPALVVRTDEGQRLFPTVPAVPLYPGSLLPASRHAHCVWQPVGNGSDPPGPGPVLPRLRPATLRRLLSGRLPRRSRWIGAWGPVWEMPWA
jgi:hypothetical protein